MNIEAIGRLKNIIKKKHKIKRILRRLRFPFSGFRKKKQYQKVVNAKNVEPLSSTRGNPRIIVSLTSYPARFNSIPLVLKSLLIQTMKPDQIVVWYDCNSDLLTKEMLEYEKYGVVFKKVEYDLGPHKKYYYALQMMNNDLVIVTDDDLIYPPDMIESLIKTHKKYPDCICTRRVHKLKLDSEYKIDKYENWIGCCFFEKKPSHLLVATTGSGTLFPPNALDERAFDRELIVKKCLYADDIWLKYIEIMNDVKVVWAPNNMPLPPEVENSQEIALGQQNVDRGRNNAYIDSLNMEFGDKIATVLEEEVKANYKNSFVEAVKEFLGEQIYCWKE